MKSKGLVGGRWYALLRGPDKLPVLFACRDDAVENMDTDEYLVPVWVYATLASDRRLARIFKAKRKGRPRIPDERKRRRGTRP
jgi:hypothetical protein